MKEEQNTFCRKEMLDSQLGGVAKWDGEFRILNLGHMLYSLIVIE